MAQERDKTKKLFLRLQTNGYITIDDDYLWDGCDTPEIDPDIELSPVRLSKLTRLLAELYSEDRDAENIERFKKLLAEFDDCRGIISDLVKSLEAEFS